MFHKKGYTITEVIITIFIFGFLVLMGTGAVNYATGKLKSSKNLELSEAMRQTMDTLNQKMNTANGKVTIGSNIYYGFDVLTGDILMVINKGTSNTCSYFYKDATAKQIKFLQNASYNNCSAIPTAATSGWQPLTPNNVEVTNFDLSPRSTLRQFPNVIPYINIKITAVEKANSTNYIELKTGYYLNYLTVNTLKQP